jgi:hypothetical protein
VYWGARHGRKITSAITQHYPASQYWSLVDNQAYSLEYLKMLLVELVKIQ